MCNTAGRFRHLKVCVVVLLVFTTFTMAEKSQSFKPFLKQGRMFLDKKKPDSAILYFVKSFSAGLSKDSLFYYWAEALLEKNALDSSLAANFVITSNIDGKFKFKVLKQRQKIYNLLGWTDDATRVMDTISAMPKYRAVRLLPDVQLNGYAGYGKNALVSDTSGPWGDGFGGTLQKRENNVSGGINVKTTWQKQRKNKLMSAGMTGGVSRYKRDNIGSKIDGDSIDINGSVFGVLTGKTATVIGNIFINNRFDDSLFVGASIEGGAAGYGKWAPVLWTGALVNMRSDGVFSNARSWMFLSVQQKVGNRSLIHNQSMLNLIISRKTQFDTRKTIGILYAEDARLKYPIFYTDQKYTTVIDTSFNYFIAKDIMASGIDSTISSVLRIPNSYFSFAPKTSITLLTKKPITIGLGWRLNCYIGDYQWDVITDDAMYLINSRADGRVYRIPESFGGIEVKKEENEGLALNKEVLPGGFIQKKYSKRRIDNAVSADFSIQLFDGIIGTGTVRSTVLKNWSTLAGTIPLDIQNWNISLFFEWNMQLQNPVRN